MHVTRYRYKTLYLKLIILIKLFIVPLHNLLFSNIQILYILFVDKKKITFPSVVSNKICPQNLSFVNILKIKGDFLNTSNFKLILVISLE